MVLGICSLSMGLEGGSNYLCGRGIMDLWDRLCSLLLTQLRMLLKPLKQQMAPLWRKMGRFFELFMQKVLLELDQQYQVLLSPAIEAATFAQQYIVVGWTPKEYNPIDKRFASEQEQSRAEQRKHSSKGSFSASI